MKTLIKFLITFSVLFLVFLFIYFNPQDYKLKYQINEITITETYSKSKAVYQILFSYQDFKFKLVSYDKYTPHRHIIKKIDVINQNDEICLLPKSDNITVYPLCSNKDGYLSGHLLKQISPKKLGYPKLQSNSATNQYKNTFIYDLMNHNYLVWNYKGFDFISPKGYKTINLFAKDRYEIELATKCNRYFVIPNYDSKYFIKQMYLYNLDQSSLKKWELQIPISIDSYVLGTDNRSLYIFDRKAKQEYELVPHKRKMRTISPRIKVRGKWKRVSKARLLNQKLKFSEPALIRYQIKQSKLYRLIGDYQELISNQKVKEIVSIQNDTVYYLEADTLYLYTPTKGEVKLLRNFEWNFNFHNLILVD